MLFLQARASVGSYYTTRRSTRGATHSTHAPNLLGWVWRTRAARRRRWGATHNTQIRRSSTTVGRAACRQANSRNMKSCRCTRVHAHSADTRVLRATSTNLDEANSRFLFTSNVRSTVGEPRGAGRPVGAFVRSVPKRNHTWHGRSRCGAPLGRADCNVFRVSSP